jgi:hypothetical protein
VWPNLTADQCDQIEQYATGAHGDGPLYFLDPALIVAEANILPVYWACPRLAVNDAPNLAGSGADTPTAVATASNTQQYPAYSAKYVLDGTETPAELWIPVPDGFTFHMGAHGAATGTAKVTATPDGDSADTLILLGNNTTTRVNYEYTPVTDSGITLAIDGAGDLTLSGMIAYILPEGATPPTGIWVAGWGHSGCRIDGEMRKWYTNPAMNMFALSAMLRETGAWEAGS